MRIAFMFKPLLLVLAILFVAACGRTELFDRSLAEPDPIDDRFDMGDANDAGADADLDSFDAAVDQDEVDQDMDSQDLGPDAEVDAGGTCSNGVFDSDETDLDCGGPECPRCDDGGQCVVDDDCQSMLCIDGFCVQPGDVGDPCETDRECGERCETFDESICTIECDADCPDGFACFDGLCTPEDFCNVATGLGPGCEQTVCALCDANATCVQDASGGFVCQCNQGWSGDGFSCGDINECTNGGAMCGANATCVNTPGSYECACDAGFEKDATGACIDIDECSNGTAGCDANATCTNTPGTFECACDMGFSGDGFMCVPDAGCTADPTLCDSNATCVNDACVCDSGYTGDGLTCTDIDECANQPCGVREVCVNEPGSFRCECAPGTVAVGGQCRILGDVCGAANLVGALPFSASGTTSNKTDQYSAPAGVCPGIFGPRGGNAPDEVWEFTPAQTGFYTIDVDEQGFIGALYVVTDCGDISGTCQGGDTFNPNVSLELTAGTTYYIIVDGGSNFSSQAGPYLIEIQLDECASGLDNCDANATCNDTSGGFFCSCDEGYSGDGTVCDDVDECALSLDNCDANATCTNTDGGFECECDSGFEGDGTVCWDPSVPGESCESPFILPSAPATVMGDTSDAFNDYEVGFGDCPGIVFGGGASRDEVWQFTPTATQDYTFTVSANHGTAVWITTDCDDLSNACIEGDTGLGSFGDAEFTVSLTAGVDYFIVVDGLSNTVDRSGPYTLSVQ